MSPGRGALFLAIRHTIEASCNRCLSANRLRQDASPSASVRPHILHTAFFRPEFLDFRPDATLLELHALRRWLYQAAFVFKASCTGKEVDDHPTKHDRRLLIRILSDIYSGLGSAQIVAFSALIRNNRCLTAHTSRFSVTTIDEVTPQS
jgi:hypothetical protein